jgi:adenylate kinase
MDALSQAIMRVAEQSEGTLILDGHYSHELLDANVVDHVFVLRKAPWRLIEILQNRLYSYEKVWENVEAEIIGVIMQEAIDLYPPEKLHELDTTNKEPEETVKEILQVINGEKATRVEPLDWIAYPETLRLLVNKTCTSS